MCCGKDRDGQLPEGVGLCCIRERPWWPVLFWGLVPSHPTFPVCYFVTSSWNARKALSLFGGGEEQDKLQNIGVGQRGTLDTSGS